MKRSRRRMDKILEAQIQALTTTRRPKTVKCYRYCAHNFLTFLHTAFPRLHQLSQLRRDPHLLAWFRFLCQQYPSPGNRTRHLHLLTARRLLRDLANQGHPVTPARLRPAASISQMLSPTTMQCSTGTPKRLAAATNTSGDGFALATSSPVTTTALAGIRSVQSSLFVCSFPPVVAIPHLTPYWLRCRSNFSAPGSGWIDRMDLLKTASCFFSSCSISILEERNPCSRAN
jgi:hypothetical protein